MNYQIELQEFHGPFDLLLHLINKNEIDIFDIPISKITEQYIQYINQYKEYDMELSSEFIVMAAKLIEIKSRMLLPPEENEAGEEIDFREELANRIFEYKIFKQISQFIKKKEDGQFKVFYKDPEYLVSNYNSITEIDIDELTNAFKKVLAMNNMERNEEVTVHKIEREVIRVEDKIVEIINMINTQNKIKFSNLFVSSKTRTNIVVTFLALLELIKKNIVKFHQLKTCDEIVISKV